MSCRNSSLLGIGFEEEVFMAVSVAGGFRELQKGERRSVSGV